MVTDETFEGIRPIREIPPNVVHEFQEDFIFGVNGHTPLDDIDLAPITLIMMDGRSKTIPYKPYPKDFGEFSMANIKVANLKAKYKPFTIYIPHGIENEPYPPEGDLPHVFQTWSRGTENGYSTSLGHTLNWWHYRRTENILEEVYLSGMTMTKDPAAELVPLAWSWLRPPQLQISGIEPKYKVQIYDPAQRAYIVPHQGRGPHKLEFAIEVDEDVKELGAPMYIVNPAFIIKDWGTSGVELKVDGKTVNQGKYFRVGYEETHTGTDLVLWLNMKSDETVKFSISPVDE